jgi:YVTN family beta-propeller protein
LPALPIAPPAIGPGQRFDTAIECQRTEGPGSTTTLRSHSTDDEIYLPLADGFLYAFDALGRQLWRTPFGQGGRAPVAIGLPDGIPQVLYANDRVRSKTLTVLAMAGALGVSLAYHTAAQAAPITSAPRNPSQAAIKVSTLPAVLDTVVVDLFPEGLAVNPATNRIYTANRTHNTVTVVDGGSDNVLANLLLGGQPHAIAVLSPLNRVYATSISSSGFGSLAVIDGSSNTVLTYVPLGAMTTPFSVAVDPNKGRVYVGEAGAAAVAVIDALTNTVDAVISGIQSPVGLALDPQTGYLYAANGGHQTVTAIDTSRNAIVGSPIFIGANAHAVAVNPVTQRVYVPTNVNTVAVIDGKVNSLVTTINAPAGYGVTADPGHNQIYVSAQGSDAVSIIDGAANSFVATVGVGQAPFGIDFNGQTGRLYVANSSSNSVTVIG